MKKSTVASDEIIERLKSEINNMTVLNNTQVDDDIQFDFTSIEFFIIGFATQLTEGKKIHPNPFEKQRILTPFIVEGKWNGHEIKGFDIENYPTLKSNVICLEKIRELVVEAISNP
ncbi:hypothetical protein [Flavobacterium quisquiliarum]|jgi:hypothetical protein|uniref:Uncharacterized protein n=1 Tax=Flavobacterium quisquiliarum TaxID=1834436 RepID=A0ABV8W7R1_9FLAO|nr:hypothetical protein [Flavobacterium quisquiliarum]MBW1655356.1 hypothetical protein [Flavobacterium quisquiliarum]NWL00742.1 hypothetical protein [Flavobacterium collinsii]